VAIAIASAVQEKSGEESDAKGQTKRGIGELSEHFVGGASRRGGVIAHAKATLFEAFEAAEYLMFSARIQDRAVRSRQFVSSLDLEHQIIHELFEGSLFGDQIFIVEFHNACLEPPGAEPWARGSYEPSSLSRAVDQNHSTHKALSQTRRNATDSLTAKGTNASLRHGIELFPRRYLS